MDIKKHLLKFLKDSMIISCSSVSGDQPWIFNAFYVSNDKGEIFWVSHNTTRHAEEFQKNNKAAMSIYDKGAMPGFIKGVQMSGTVKELSYDEAVEILKIYTDKFNSKLTAEDIKEDKTRRMFKFTPDKILMRDSHEFEDRMEVEL
jgi:uncharacterized protein YhbP (UPF0306 family)